MKRFMILSSIIILVFTFNFMSFAESEPAPGSDPATEEAPDTAQPPVRVRRFGRGPKRYRAKVLCMRIIWRRIRTRYRVRRGGRWVWRYRTRRRAIRRTRRYRIFVRARTRAHARRIIRRRFRGRRCKRFRIVNLRRVRRRR